MTESETPSPSPTEYSQPINTSTPTPTANRNDVILDFPTPSANSAVIQHCLGIQNDLPKDRSYTGTIILDNRKLSLINKDGLTFLMHLPDLREQIMPEIRGMKDIIPNYNNISPSRKWFFYFLPSGQAGSRIHIRSIDGKEWPIAYWDDAWGQGVEWVNDHMLLILPKDEADWLNGINISLDLDSGKWEKITPTLPSGLNIDTPFISYSPTMMRAIYHSGDSFVLWSPESQQDIWRKGRANLFSTPGWSPNGNYFAMSFMKDEVRQSDIFLVNPDGQEIQLTDFSKAYPNMNEIYIEDMEWSPNGRYISFTLTVEDNVNTIKSSDLMLVDIETKQVIDYCLTFYERGHFVWSPNSEQILFATPVDYKEYIETIHQVKEQKVEVLLVDIKKEVAVKISEDKVAVGWMVTP